ncbi:alkaline phosphatase PhoX [Candidatus Nitrospira salsa]
MTRLAVFFNVLFGFAGVFLISCSMIPQASGPVQSFTFVSLIRSAVPGSMSPCAPFLLPEGFTQSILIQERPLCSNARRTLDVIVDTSDRTDMNTVNETGSEVGRYLYRTHETDEGRGAISVMDLQTGQMAVHRGEKFGGWNRMDGIKWTPWGTLLTAEESGAYGRLFECRVERLLLSCVDRPAVGRMSHEGIAVTRDGSVYVVDEFDGGSIFKFVSGTYGDLSSGQLFALNVQSDDITMCSETAGVGFIPTGNAEWVPLTPGRGRVVTDPAYNARAAAREARVTQFCRPEDVEIIEDHLYVAMTTTHTVFQVSLSSEQPVVTEYVGINTNMNSEESVPAYSLSNPDNLASDQAGNLYIVEDNAGENDIWMATPDMDGNGEADSVVLFATMTTRGAEASGIYFPPQGPTRMFVNVQHADDGNDMTLVITQDGERE